MIKPKDLTCLSMMDLLAAYRHPIAAEVAAIVPDGNPLADMIRYHLGLDQGEPSGKYVRSALCLAMCQAWGGDFHIALPGSAAVELIHRCSLIFDDIQDQSEYRNGRLALWKTVGPARALNAGLALSCLPRIALHRIRGGTDAEMAVRVDGVLEEAVMELCRGQDMDVSGPPGGNVAPGDAGRLCPDKWRGWREAGAGRWPEPDSPQIWHITGWYMEMIRLKTGVLTGAAAGVGAILAGGHYEQARAFGENLGVLFQLQDDVLGVWGDESATGKPMVDLANGKLTLVSVVGLSMGVNGLGQFLKEARELSMPAEKTASMKAELEKRGVRAECERAKKDQLEKTLLSVAAQYLDDGWRGRFRDLAVFVAGREK